MDGPALRLGFLGPFVATRGGEPVPLPRSQKTRALLAYLAVTRRPHTRERLCALLWDVADDPRGALRWSLSKLRPLVDGPGPRLVTDRDGVALESTGIHVDAFEIERALSVGLGGRSIDELVSLVEAHRGELLEGLDLGDFEE